MYRYVDIMGGEYVDVDFVCKYVHNVNIVCRYVDIMCRYYLPGICSNCRGCR